MLFSRPLSLPPLTLGSQNTGRAISLPKVSRVKKHLKVLRLNLIFLDLPRMDFKFRRNETVNQERKGDNGVLLGQGAHVREGTAELL